jgi:hypothetical protein
MKPNLVLTVSAIYLALIGLGLIFVPDALAMGMLASATPYVIWGFRGWGASLIGVAVIQAVARNASGSPARNAIFLGGTVGYGLVTIIEIVGQLTVSGAPAAQWVYTVINALFAIWFFVVGRASMSS